MLNSEEIENKLRELADTFIQAIRKQDWYRAKFSYDTAVRVAYFLNVDESLCVELFGIHGDPDQDIVEGRFRDEYVLKAYEECIKKDMTFQDLPPLRMPAAKRQPMH